MVSDERSLGELARLSIAFHTFKDHVIFERSEVLTQSGQPFSVFTPYKNAWLKRFEPNMAEPHELPDSALPFAPRPQPMPQGPQADATPWWLNGVPELHDVRIRCRQAELRGGPAGVPIAQFAAGPRQGLAIACGLSLPVIAARRFKGLRDQGQPLLGHEVGMLGDRPVGQRVDESVFVHECSAHAPKSM